MITPPTDRLYKFAAIGGLALALAGGTGALRQYHETGLQFAEFVGTVMKQEAVYNRFASMAREQITWNEKLKDANLDPAERELLEARTREFRRMLPSFDKDFEEATAAARRQEVITRHYRRMQAIWLTLAGVAIGAGGFISYRGFTVWRRRAKKEP
jgi:hypothetical protein